MKGKRRKVKNIPSIIKHEGGLVIDKLKNEHISDLEKSIIFCDYGNRINPPCIHKFGNREYVGRNPSYLEGLILNRFPLSRE